MKYIFFLIIIIFSLSNYSFSKNENRIPYKEYETTLNVVSFGAKGDGKNDDTEAFLSLAKKANSLNSVSIYIPKGTYIIKKKIVFKSKKINFFGDGINNTILDFSKGELSPGETHLLFTGNAEILRNPRKKLNKDKSELRLSSNKVQIKPGDFFTIKNNEDFSYSKYRKYYKSGEIIEVKDMQNRTITTTNPFFDNYSLSKNLKFSKISPITCDIQNFSILMKRTNELGNVGLMVTFGLNSTIRNIKAQGTNFSHITLNTCYNSKISEIQIDYSSKDIGYNYGITIANSQNIEVSNCKLKAERHGIAIGGYDYDYSVVNRNILVYNCTIDAYDGFGADMHGNVEFITYKNCVLKSGVSVGGNNTAIQNCQIQTDKNGIGVYFGEIKGGNHIIADNTITCLQNKDKKEFNGIIRASTVGHLVGGKTIIDNNTIYIKRNARAYSFYNNAPSALYNLQISNNTINFTGETWNECGISVRGEIDSISIVNNTINKGDIFVYHTNSNWISIDNNRVTGSNSYGIIANLAPTKNGKTIININNNIISNSGLTGLFIRGNNSRLTNVIVSNNNILNSNSKRKDSKLYNASLYADQLNSISINQNRMSSNNTNNSQDYLFTVTNVNELNLVQNNESSGKLTPYIDQVNRITRK